jgi:uncharacterized membrane protein YphA (DoxX/SURF4 family)
MKGPDRLTAYSGFLLFSRLVLALLFILSGSEKLMAPPEEFMQVIKGYQILAPPFLRPAALLLPWLELLSGVFLLVGLFYQISVRAVGALLILFTAAIGSALLRGISMEDCGCLKSLGFRESVPVALARNLILLLFWLNLLFDRKPKWTVDHWLQGREE